VATGQELRAFQKSRSAGPAIGEPQQVGETFGKGTLGLGPADVPPGDIGRSLRRPGTLAPCSAAITPPERAGAFCDGQGTLAGRPMSRSKEAITATVRRHMAPGRPDFLCQLLTGAAPGRGPSQAGPGGRRALLALRSGGKFPRGEQHNKRPRHQLSDPRLKALSGRALRPWRLPRHRPVSSGQVIGLLPEGGGSRGWLGACATGSLLQQILPNQMLFGTDRPLPTAGTAQMQSTFSLAPRSSRD